MGGGNKGGGTVVQQQSYDPEASRRLAAVAERQQDLAEEAMEYYYDVFKPYETEAVDRARANLEARGALDAAQLAAQQELLPDRQALEQAAVREQLRDIEANRELRDAAREEQMREIQRSSLAADKFYDTALKGVDVEDRLQRATADVVAGFSKAQQQTARQAGRYGISPRAADFTSSGLEQAKAMAGARTGTRIAAEKESFDMLKSAMAARGVGIPNVPGVAGQGSVPYSASGGNIADRYGITSPQQQAVQFGQLATQGYGALASRVMSSSQTGPAQGGVGALGGAMAGASAGAAFGWQGAAIGGLAGGVLGMF